MAKYIFLFAFIMSSLSFAGVAESHLSYDKHFEENSTDSQNRLSNKEINSFSTIPLISVETLLTQIMGSSTFEEWEVIIPEAFKLWFEVNNIQSYLSDISQISKDMFAHSLTKKPVLFSKNFREFFSDAHLDFISKDSKFIVIKYVFFPESVFEYKSNREGPFFFYLIKEISEDKSKISSLSSPLTFYEEYYFVKSYKENYKIYDQVVSYMAHSNFNESFNLIREMPDYSIPHLQFLYALHLINGLNCEKNISEGYKRLKIAAFEGHDLAFSLLVSNFSLNPNFTNLHLNLNEQPSEIPRPHLNFSFLQLPTDIQIKMMSQMDRESFKNFKKASKHTHNLAKLMRPINQFNITYYLFNKLFVYSSDLKMTAYPLDYFNNKEYIIAAIKDINHTNLLEDITDDITISTFSPNNKELLTGHSKGTVKIWDKKSGECVQTLVGESSEIKTISFSNDEQKLLIFYLNHKVEVWNPSSGKKIISFDSASNFNPIFSHDGKKILSTVKYEHEGLNKVKPVLRNSETGEIIQTFEFSFLISHKAFFSLDDSSVIIALDDSLIMNGDQYKTNENRCDSVHILNVNSGKLFKKFPLKEKIIHSIILSPDRTKMGILTFLNLEIFDLNSNQSIFNYTGNYGSQMNFSFSPDSKKIMIYGYYKKLVKIWDIHTNELITILEGNQGLINFASFSKDGTQAFISSSGKAKIFDLRFLK